MKNYKKPFVSLALLSTVFTGVAAQAQPSAELPSVATVSTDWTLKPQSQRSQTATLPTLSDKTSRLIMTDIKAADLAPAKPGFDLQAAIRAQGSFNKNAANDTNSQNVSMPDNGSQQQWQANNGYRIRPEIEIWHTDNSHVTIRPKGRGVMIGLKITQ